MGRTATIDRRADPPATPTETGFDRVLGHPAAFLVTTAVLLAIFGATFVMHPGRSAPTRDPAYYTWRTQVLRTEHPGTILEIEGPKGLHSGGYRISAPVIAGIVSRTADMEVHSAVTLLMVVVPILTALLLAGFAYRHRRDPLMWHSVAFASAGLMLTPPFVGYLDNTLGVFFLAAALWFLGSARVSWAGRVGLVLFLVVMGVTHTTTLAIFVLMLIGIAFVRLLFARFDEAARGLGPRLRAVVAADGPMVAVGLATAAMTYLVWTVGIWGEPAPLSESALVFPYDKSFFMDRLGEWVAAMRPLLNGPLLVAGLVGLLAVGRRWAEDDLARVSLVWLGPLLGTFGFLVGLEYPYYRFFNTTLAWVLLVGVGAFFVMRFLIARASRAGMPSFAVPGVAAVVLILATNFSTGLVASHWNDPTRGWLTPQKRLNLDLLRLNLTRLDERDRPVVFISDARPPEIQGLPQIWGITQLNGNTMRYGLPPGQVDRAYIYQGSLESYLDGEPTVTGNEPYDDLARASLADIEDDGAREGELIVVAEVFNENGPNAELAAGEADAPPGAEGEDIWVLHDGRVQAVTGDTQPVIDSLEEPLRATGPQPSAAHLAWVIAVAAVLVVPGLVGLRWFFPAAGVAEYVAMAPTLSLCLLVFTGTAVLAVVRAPLSTGLAWAIVVLAAAIAGCFALLHRRELGTEPAVTRPS